MDTTRYLIVALVLFAFSYVLVMQVCAEENIENIQERGGRVVDTSTVPVLSIKKTSTPVLRVVEDEETPEGTVSEEHKKAGSPSEPRQQDPREIFARGNRFYEEGKYGDAISEYEKLIREGYRSANLYYNLGNAYLKLDRKGPAILYYKKALKMKPRDQDIKSNLSYALSLIKDRIKPARRLWLWRRWNGFVRYFNLRELTAAAVGLYWLLIAAIIVFVYAPGRRQGILKVALVLLVLLILSVAGGLSRAYLDGQEEAVILAKSVKVRYGPSERDVTAFVLHEGALVEVENRKGDWLQISLPDGKAGWVKIESVGLI